MIREHYVPLYQRLCNAKRMRKLPDDTCRLFFPLLLTQCDSWGRCHADTEKLWSDIWATFGKTVKDTERALKELAKVGLLVLYELGGERYLWIPDWEEKAGKVGRVNRRGESRYPEPPPCGSTPDNSGSTPADSGSTPTSTEPTSGVVPPRARAQSEPSRELSQAKPSREEPASGDAPPWEPALVEHRAMDTPDVRMSVEAWRKHRSRRRYPVWDEAQWTKNLGIFAAFGRDGPERFVAAVEHSSVTNTYQSIQEPKSHAGPRINADRGGSVRRDDGTRAGEYSEPVVMPRIVRSGGS